MSKGERIYYRCPVSFSYPIKGDEELTTEIQLANDLQEIRVFLNGNMVFSRALEKVN